MVRNLTPAARALRKRLTPQETKLWARLQRLDRRGWKFHRQSIIGRYIVDFASFHPKLVIEVDGGQHNEPEHREKDAARDAFLASEGFSVLRIWNHEIDEDPDAVIEGVLALLGANPRRTRRNR